MDYKFFVRFSLQRMGGCLEDDFFNSRDMLGVTEDDISSFVCECHDRQQEIADKLSAEYADRISCIYGKRTLFVGDSITTDRLGYRGIVTKAAKLEDRNMSYSGATSVDMYRYLYSNLVEFKPQLISVMIGTNDAFGHCGKEMGRLVSPEEYRRNIHGILNNCMKNGARVIVMTIPQMNREFFAQTPDYMYKDNDDENIARYNRIVREEVKQAGAELVDLEKALSEKSKEGLYEPDGVHLSIKGQSMLADLWLNKLLEK